MLLTWAYNTTTAVAAAAWQACLFEFVDAEVDAVGAVGALQQQGRP